MKVTIWKYNNNGDWTKPAPYFFSASANFVDKIILDGVKDNGAPRWSERGERPDEFYKMESESYTVKFSLMHTVTSTLGYGLREFLIPNSDTKNFLAAIEVDLGFRKLYGEIVHPIENNINYVTDYESTLTFSGHEAGLMAFMSTLIVAPYGSYSEHPNSAYLWKTYLELIVFGGIATRFTGLDYTLFDGDFPIDFYVSNPLQRRLHMQNTITKRDNFLAFAYTLGFQYKLEPVSEGVFGWNFKLSLIRPVFITRNTAKTVDVLANRPLIETVRMQNKALALIPTGKFNAILSIERETDCYYGALWYGKGNYAVYDGQYSLAANKLNRLISINDKSVIYGNSDTTAELTSNKDNVNIMDLTFYKQNLLKARYWQTSTFPGVYNPITNVDMEITLGRMCVTDWYFVQGLGEFGEYRDNFLFMSDNTSIVQYQRMIRGTVKQLKGGIVYDENNTVQRYDKVTVNTGYGNEDYWATELDADTQTREADVIMELL